MITVPIREITIDPRQPLRFEKKKNIAASYPRRPGLRLDEHRCADRRLAQQRAQDPGVRPHTAGG